MAVDGVQLVEFLLPKFEAQVQYLVLHKPGPVEQACNPCTGEAEVDQEFKAILCYKMSSQPPWAT